MDWNAFDFAVAGVLLAGAALAYMLVSRTALGEHRLAAAAVVLGALLFVWAELAVGVVGSPLAGN